jgi:hypothetical protein
MPLITKGGILLRVGTSLATSTNCCCGFASCADCVATMAGISLTLSGYTNGSEPPFGLSQYFCDYANLNGTYGLTDYISNGKFSITTGHGTCDPIGRGIPVSHREFLDGSVNTCYVTKITAQVSCVGPNVVLISWPLFDTSLVRDAATCSWGGGCSVIPTLGPVSSPATWEDWCNSGAPACLSGTADDCSPMSVSACARRL